MKNKNLVALVAASLTAVTFVGCHKKITSDKDKLSYTIGVQFAKNLKRQNIQIDGQALAQAVDDVMSGKKDLALSDKDMQAAMQKMNKDRQEKMQAEAKANEKTAEDFLKENKAKPGVKVTASGLQYIMEKPGTGPSPKADDTVVVNYVGTLTNGKKFDSSYDRHQPAEFPLKGVIPGWTEALQLMKKGGKAKLFIPPNLAYGPQARPGIPANSVLVFDVELLDVKHPKAVKKHTGHKAAKKK